MNVNLPGRLGTLDFDDWILGLWSAVISGGSTAVSTSVGLIAIDPGDFNLQHAKLFITAGWLFLWSGFLGMMNFLRTRPAPSVKTTTSTMQKTETKASGATVEMKLEQKVVEPMPVIPADTKEKP